MCSSDLTDGQSSVEVDPEVMTLQGALDALEATAPGIMQRLVGDTGELRRFINIYVNDEDIRYMQKEQTPVKAGDTVSIIPSVAGGAR